MKPLVVNVAELLRRPGSDRPLEAVVTAEELGVVDPRVEPADTVAVQVKLESLSDGIVVTGRVRSPWRDSCRRCLVPIEGTAEAEVEELYSQRQVDEAFPVVGEQIDLAPMARELVVLELPMAPLCRPDCAGICPSCGVNRNETPCDCAPPAPDDRWAALDALREQLN